MQKLSLMYASLLLVALTFSASVLLAQADIDVNVTKSTESTWYTNPIVWVVGGAVFLLLLVALLRGGKK